MESTALSGHLTMQLDGESVTFPLPLYADTQIQFWGPGWRAHPGMFWQREWPAEEIVRWQKRDTAYRRADRRWGWLSRTTRLAWLYDRVMPMAPEPPARALISDNYAEQYVVMDAPGMVVRHSNRVAGGDPWPTFSAIDT